MISIIDYGMGNIASVKKALDFLQLDSVITCDYNVIKNSSHIILPGVGSFGQGMKNIKERGLDLILNEQVISQKKPFLGICLGMQLIADYGDEPVLTAGLGWIKGHVTKINSSLRIPHMGWNNIDIKIDKYYNCIESKDYYFIHSYHLIPENSSIIAATVNYGCDLVASVQSENIFATQFHPEKSQESGLRLINNFIGNA
jgi:glutamine amidotransferase